MSDQPTGGSNERRLLYRSPRSLLQRMGRLVRKEVSTILRDRRTIITLVLMPLLLYPLLTIAFRQFLLASSLQETEEPDYRIGFRTGPQQMSSAEKAFIARLLRGQELLALSEQRPPAAGPPGRREETSSGPGRKARHTPGFQHAVAKDLELALRSNATDLGIRVDEGPRLKGSRFDKHYICTILYLEDSSRSREAKEYVERCLAAANNRSLASRLSAEPLETFRPIQLISPLAEPVEPTGPKETIPLSLLVP